MILDYITFVDKIQCCGCSGCVQACPQKCISMSIDSEGFWYPQVNKEKCIQCNSCDKVCPVLNSDNLEKGNFVAYAAQNINEEERLSSSSGGIFELLSRFVLSKGGVVFGAAFDDEWMLRHISIEKLEDLECLKGSKYLQSKIENTYIEARTFLKEGKQVLFSGTGCQIAGLRKFLHYDYDNLLTVDILCHGVPSPMIWQEYLKELENKHRKKVKQVYFRNKAEGWKKCQVRVVFDDGSQFISKFYDNPYMRLFLSNISLRPSCYDCKFKSVERVSDFTIGDAWGVNNLLPEMDDDKGTSIVLVHSQKGRMILGEIEGDLLACEVEIDDLLPPSADSRRSVAVHPNRKVFFKTVNKIGVEKSLRYLKKPLSIRIFNLILRKLRG